MTVNLGYQCYDNEKKLEEMKTIVTKTITRTG